MMAKASDTETIFYHENSRRQSNFRFGGGVYKNNSRQTFING